MSNSKQLPKILYESATHHLASSLSRYTAASRSLCCSPSSAIQKYKRTFMSTLPISLQSTTQNIGTPAIFVDRKLQKITESELPMLPSHNPINVLCFWRSQIVKRSNISFRLSTCTRARQMETLKLAKNRDPTACSNLSATLQACDRVCYTWQSGIHDVTRTRKDGCPILKSQPPYSFYSPQ